MLLFAFTRVFLRKYLREQEYVFVQNLNKL